MADQYIPGLQFQDWTKVPSLTNDALGTFLATAIGGPVFAAMRSMKNSQSSESGSSALPGVIPQQNQQNWQDIPAPQIGVPPTSSIGLNPSKIGQPSMGIKPIVGIPPQVGVLPQNSMSITPNQGVEDISKLKQSVWED
jgi:hypothetical protein